MRSKPFSCLLPSSLLRGIAHDILSTVSLCFPPSTKQYRKIDKPKVCTRCQIPINYCRLVCGSKMPRSIA